MLNTLDFEIIKLICQGLNNNEIGQKLFCSKACIKMHISKIQKLFNAKNRVHIAYIAGINHLFE